MMRRRDGVLFTDASKKVECTTQPPPHHPTNPIRNVSLSRGFVEICLQCMPKICRQVFKSASQWFGAARLSESKWCTKKAITMRIQHEHIHGKE
jgi:hypothetical protein